MIPAISDEILESDWAMPMLGSVGMEIWRPPVGGNDAITQTIHAIQIFERLGYLAYGFTEQTQSWLFRAGWHEDLVGDMATAVPDHEAFFDTFTLMAAAAAHTSTIFLGTVTDCFRRPPSVLAQTLLTLDHISRGRAHLVLGTGENKQFLPYGLERPTDKPNSRLEEAVRIMKALMASPDPVTLDTKFWRVEDALIGLQPYNPEVTPPIVLAGGGERLMKAAARVADGVHSYFPGSYANQIESWERDLATLREEAERVGRDPASLQVNPFSMCTVLCENDNQVERALESNYLKMMVLNFTPTGRHWREWGSVHPLGDDWMLSQTHRSTKFNRDEVAKAVGQVTGNDIQQMMYTGTPEDVAKRAAPWFQASGATAVPLTLHGNASVLILPELRELAEDGLPRWHHLNLRYVKALNEILARP